VCQALPVHYPSPIFIPCFVDRAVGPWFARAECSVRKRMLSDVVADLLSDMHEASIGGCKRVCNRLVPGSLAEALSVCCLRQHGSGLRSAGAAEV